MLFRRERDEMTIPDADIILEGSLKRCKRYKLFKTKWSDRHFVLYCRDRNRRLYTIDEYKTSKKTDLKKKFNLDFVNRVESNLSFSEHSISCSSSTFFHDDSIDWIFAIGFRVDNMQKDLYLVAKNEAEMNLWVNQLCKLCKLRRQTDDEADISQAAESSISGMSMSSQSLDMSIIEQQQQQRQQQYAENLSEPNKYLRMQHFKSVNSQQSIARDSNPNYSNLPETSSMRSSRRTEDDSVSYTSGPPIPPPRSRYAKGRYAKHSLINRLHMTPASTSMSQVVRGDPDHSSGETLKNDAAPETYPESVTSSEGISVYERNGRTLIRKPPPVDRSNKPKSMRGDEDGAWYRNLGKNSEVENESYGDANISRNSNFQQRDLSKRRNLDYFEPSQIVQNSSSSTVAASTRSPTPSDIEYIVVDVDRTLAFKQMRRATPSAD